MKQPLPYQIYSLLGLLLLCILCASSNNKCTVTQEVADCSHLKLTQVPDDLPTNITVLNLTHNQLRRLPPANFTRYSKLTVLDGGFNSISKLEPELCQNLPLLKILNLQHNELSHVSDKTFMFCVNLTELHLMSNSIQKIQNNPFRNQKNLVKLDLSHNGLSSTKLGTQLQLENLQELRLSNNKIHALRSEELDFLGNSSLQKLELSSNQIKEISPGCFHVIGKLFGLLLNNAQLGPSLTEKLCLELSNTSIQNLSLSNTQLYRTSNTTFFGLKQTNLTMLDLSHNNLNVIGNDSFVWLPHLKYLFLEYNNIAHLSSRSFYGLSNVRYLNLKRSFTKQSISLASLPKIDDLSFQWLKCLEYLNMDDNNIPGIKSGMFTGLINLKYLGLSNTFTNLQTLTNETFLSLAHSPLRVLNLTRNKISKLESGAFSCLGDLEVLDLGLNEIEQELTGQEWRGLGNIFEIYLSYNKYLQLTSNSFASVPGLQRLMLRRVGLKSIDSSPSPFHNLRDLTILDLSNNNIANIDEEMLEGLEKLEILDLQHNNLARLWKHVNPGGPVHFLKGLYHLHILNLESNGFDEIPADVFKDLLELKSINLGLNNLNILPPSVFDHQLSLKSLNLQKNLITSVEKNVFEPVFQNLTYLDMRFNPFDCTCESIAWFVNWINKTHTHISELSSHYVCNTPHQSHGFPVMLFDTAPCKDSAPFELFFMISTSVLLIFIFIVLLIHFEGWRISFFWNVLVHRVLGFKEVDGQPEQFEYTAYIIHAYKDRDWVWENFSPLEEKDQSLKFCLEERDFEAGALELEAIVNSIKRSRKIVFIITQHLLKDPLCKRFKVHHAVQQAIEQNLDSIILIFLENIPDYKLNHALCLRRGMFRSHCILNWPVQKERTNAFHHKLQVALGSRNTVY
ncbi:toll-like receptor 3 isoform X1 [Cavia porcellus]|uniref:Toll-like receptor 3 n=1 Tax=Cavia porcellus TaxID=10141 RepID=A3QRJ8_CAVPO|nr:toll-like receptor 3 precursor [Cavia porcellus]XP_005003432.1 toll-like receptor 3 isoform X1 [Cavia porcellus]XP_013007061.1 toll-like receptor 3 isoform X1 [Cavia porcellus]ABD77101.1 toll-like receptor 3 [Cavia porcellus]